MSTVDSILAYVYEMRQMDIEPVEVRLGAENYHELLLTFPDYVPMPGLQERVFGVPIRILPIGRCVSVR